MHQVVQELQDLHQQMSQVIGQLQQMHQRLHMAMSSAQQQQQLQMQTHGSVLPSVQTAMPSPTQQSANRLPSPPSSPAGTHTLSRTAGSTIGSGLPATGRASDTRLSSGVHSYGAAYAPPGPSSAATSGNQGRGINPGALAAVLRADGNQPATPGRQSEHTVYGRLM